MSQRHIDLHRIGNTLRATDLGDDQRGDFLPARHQRAMHTAHVVGTLVHAQPWPGAAVERTARGVNRSVGTGGIAHRRVADHLLGGGVEHGCGRAVFRNPGAVYIEFVQLRKWNAHPATAPLVMPVPAVPVMISAPRMAMAMAGALLL